MLKNINKLPDEKEWVQSFMQTSTYSSIFESVQKMERIVKVSYDSTQWDYIDVTPREHDLSLGKLDLQPFYILDYISKNNNKVIYDVGCGYNFFKKFYNVIGVDIKKEHADIFDYYTNGFIKNFRCSYDNAITINAIHFCKSIEISNRVLGFLDLVKSGGYAYVAINTHRLYDKSSYTIIEMQQFLKENIVDMVQDEILYLYENIQDDAYLNGNFRILVKRKS